LAWKGGCVSYSVQADASPARNVDYDAIHAIVERAFDRWTNADCGGDVPSLTSLDLGPVDCSVPEYNSNNPNANVVMFRDTDWPYEDPGATLALTTVTFNTETGEIFDADIEVNSFKTPLSTSDTAVVFDLESIITHEAGHFLGLSHSHIEGATMFTPYIRGDVSFRDLSADDEQGMCAAYPPERKASANDCRPRHGFSPECAGPPDTGCACRTTPEGPVPAWPLALLLMVGAPLGLRRIRTEPNA
jgi:MYXO-CTERM domain-containing protein